MLKRKGEKKEGLVNSNIDYIKLVDKTWMWHLTREHKALS
jgi:hypothetical protein